MGCCAVKITFRSTINQWEGKERTDTIRCFRKRGKSEQFKTRIQNRVSKFPIVLAKIECFLFTSSDNKFISNDT